MLLTAVLVWRFLRTGGPEMLRMMSVPEAAMVHEHGGHEAQPHHTTTDEAMHPARAPVDHAGHAHDGEH